MQDDQDNLTLIWYLLQIIQMNLTQLQIILLA